MLGWPVGMSVQDCAKLITVRGPSPECLALFLRKGFLSRGWRRQAEHGQASAHVRKRALPRSYLSALDYGCEWSWLLLVPAS